MHLLSVLRIVLNYYFELMMLYIEYYITLLPKYDEHLLKNIA